MSADPVTFSTDEWLTSEQARRLLKISACHLMHLREGGILRFEKKGNAFLYVKADVEREKKRVAC